MILALIAILIVILVMNVVPAFMPPTWMLLSLVGYYFHISDISLVIFSIMAAIAATAGRSILALLSKKIIRNKLLNETAIQNIDALKDGIEKRKVFTAGFFLLFAFSPFPSGQLFLAYGLTSLKLWIATVPFFIGRAVSYTFWAYSASEVSERLDVLNLQSGSYFSTYFILAQIVAFMMVYLFIKLDWQALFVEHKIRFVKKIIKKIDKETFIK